MVPPPLLLLLAAAQLAIGAADEAPPPPPLRCHPDANPPEVCPGGDPCPQCGADVCDCPGPAPPPPPGCPFFARDILLDLYNSTDGENWKKNDGWDSVDAFCCEWHGVRYGELACSALSALSRCCMLLLSDASGPLAAATTTAAPSPSSASLRTCSKARWWRASASWMVWKSS